MITRPSQPVEESTAAAAYPDAGETEQLRGGRLRFFRTIAESVGVQGPTAGVVIAAAVLAGVSGGGTALVLIVAAVAMGFVRENGVLPGVQALRRQLLAQPDDQARHLGA